VLRNFRPTASVCEDTEMKSNLVRSLITLTLIGCVLGPGSRLMAGASPSAVLLVQAYQTLEHADHDYKGHRIAAMKQIESAAKLLGVKVHGDGKGHEKQAVSDEQLRAAQSLLQQARPGLSGKPLAHVNKAIQQLLVALSIR
jgi:hypothetical protein